MAQKGENNSSFHHWLSSPAAFSEAVSFSPFQKHFVTTEAHMVTQILNTLLFALT